MQLVRFQLADRSVTWGVQHEGRLFDLGSWKGFAEGAAELRHHLIAPRTTSDLEMLWSMANWEQARGDLDKAVGDLAPTHAARLLCPIPAGGRIICIGLNYRDHAIESGMEIPSEPVVFNKWSGALCGPEDEVPLPASSRAVDYEAELVVVVGKPAWQVDEAAAEESIFGYSCGHDVSSRDWQLGRPGGQWLLGKSFPNFAPVGPAIVPKEFVPNAGELRIELRVNGETLQSSTTAQLIFSPPRLISFLSKFCHLEPGDIIFTGTPPGVGMARKPPRFLSVGDVCEVEVESIGVLRNSFT
jgi:2-keto-4-pentenoate hydratase/2-oxohepta-3-ene-1,7-dioic acid hydratase in catechol pathway